MTLKKDERERLCRWASSWREFHNWYECRQTHCLGDIMCSYRYPDGIPLTDNIDVVVFDDKLAKIYVRVPQNRHWFLEGIFGTKTETYTIYPNEDGPWWAEIVKHLPKAENNIKEKWAKENSKRQSALNKIAESLYGK